MDLENAKPGHAFEGDYPGFYGDVPGGLHEDMQRLHDVLRRQRAELERLRRDPARRAKIMGILQGRRSGRADLAQLDVVPHADGREAVVAHGEVVLTPEAYAATRVRDVLTARGLREQPGSFEDRCGVVVRLRHPRLAPGGLGKVIEELGRHGVTGQPHFVAAAAAVGKGIGGPEPVAGLGAFSAYPVPVNGGPPARVAVVDTGIAGDLREDGWLTDVLRCSTNIDPLDDLPAGPDGHLDFQAGHGTFVAGVIRQVAPGAEIRVYKAADSDGFGLDRDIADAMKRAFEQGAQIINVSLASETAAGEPPTAFVQAVQEIRSAPGGKDVVIVAAAGNSGENTPLWPAALGEEMGVVAVAGLRNDLTAADWSTRGDWVKFATVGEGIRSTFVAGKESPVFDPEPDEFPDPRWPGADAWAFWTGSSFAAPQIAGAIARICQELGLSPTEAVKKLYERSAPATELGKNARAMKILPGLG